RAVDVVEEHLQRFEALGQTTLDPAPLAGGHDAWHETNGHHLLGAALVRVHGERDALLDQRQLSEGLTSPEGLRGQPRKQCCGDPGVRARDTRAVDQLVVATLERPVRFQERRSLRFDQHAVQSTASLRVISTPTRLGYESQTT